MDPASLDPRLRDAGEDSIVVRDATQHATQSTREREEEEEGDAGDDDAEDDDDDDENDDENGDDNDDDDDAATEATAAALAATVGDDDDDDDDEDGYDDRDFISDESPREQQRRPQQQQQQHQHQHQPFRPLTPATVTSTTGTTTGTTTAGNPFFVPPPGSDNSKQNTVTPSAPATAVALGIAPALAPAAPLLPTPAPTRTGDAASQDPSDPKRPRACEACRGLKVKCEPDPFNADGPCKRCAKAGRACVVTQPTRKRQKKTDSRVAELEKKIDALTASLQASRGQHPLPSASSTQARTHMQAQAQSHLQPQPRPQHPHRSSGADDPSSISTTTRIAKEWGPPVLPLLDAFRPDNNKTAAMAGQKRKFPADTPEGADSLSGPRRMSMPRPGSHPQHPEFPSQLQQPQPQHQHQQPLQHQLQQQHQQHQQQAQPPPDVVDRGIITADESSALFQRYTDRMATHLPAVVFPPGTTAADVRRPRPILFLAIMSVASSETPSLQRLLVKELMQIFADKLIIQGEKSLELVQSIMVSVVWYFPPEHFEQLKFYQMVHIAAVMAIDIGLGRRKNSPKSRLIPYTWRDHPFRRHPLPDPSTIESRRTWLAVYFLASNVAMALHRPNLVRWQSFMTECMDILESSPDAAPSDRYLCHLVWTHRLAEEVGIQFSMDDPSIFVNVTDQKVQYALRGFERDLHKYSENIPKQDKQPSLLLSFSVLNLYMHEIALQTNEDHTPSNPEALRDPIPGLGDSLTAAHIGALSSCLTAIDGIFEIFLSLDVPTIRCLPIFNFVRVAYALIVLVKIYFSASSPNSELGKVINKDHMKVAEYIDSLLEKFRETAAQDKSRPAGKFLVVLAMVKGWFHQQGAQGRSHTTDAKSEAPPQPHQSNPGADPQTSTATGPHPGTIHSRQRQQQHPYQTPQSSKQSEYESANTPLQLLSEIATGNAPPQGQTTASHPVGGLNTPGQAQPQPQPHSAWGTAGVHVPYVFDPATGLPANAASGMGPVAMGGQPQIPWTNSPFGGDMNYLSMGDGFEQAMGLTLTGFGGGSPGDNASYENTLRMMGDNGNLMGAMDDFANAGGGFSF